MLALWDMPPQKCDLCEQKMNPTVRVYNNNTFLYAVCFHHMKNLPDIAAKSLERFLIGNVDLQSHPYQKRVTFFIREVKKPFFLFFSRFNPAYKVPVYAANGYHACVNEAIMSNKIGDRLVGIIAL